MPTGRSEFGYDLGGEAVELFQTHEASVYSKIEGHNETIDYYVNKMEDLEKFLSLLANRTEDSTRVDLTTAEEMELVDRLREEEDLRFVFPEGKYSWKTKEEIDNVTRLVNQKIEGPLQRKINMASEQMVLEQHELTKVLEIFRNGLSRMNNLIDRILGNIQKAH